MPLFWLSSAFLCGIVTGWLLGGSVPAWLAGAAAFLFLILLSVHLFFRLRSPQSGLLGRAAAHWPADREVLLPGYVLPLLPLFSLLGLACYSASLPSITPSHLAWYNDQPGRFRVEGVVVADPEFRDAYTLLEVEAGGLRQPDGAVFQPVEGLLLARLPPGGGWRYGDRILLEGRLRSPFETEEFSYRAYLAHQGIYTTLSCGYCQDCDEPLSKECAWLIERGQGSPVRSAIYALRRRALGVIYALFPDPEASLLAGILLGVETGIPEQVLEAFRVTGTSHIIAISGFNFAIVSGLLVVVFGRLLGRWRGMLAAWVGIAFYAVLAGATPGVIRAALMGSLAVFALRFGRRSSGLNTLAFVAALMAVFDPHVLWDVGFQLSFMATLGLMLYAGPLTASFTHSAGRWLPQEKARRLAALVGEYLLFTLAAQLTTLPLILYYFRQASLISLVANPLVLPAQPPLMVLGGLATLAGLAFLPLGRVASILAWPWIAYTIRMVELLASLPAAAVSFGPLSLWGLGIFYLLLFSITLFWGRIKNLSAKLIGGPSLGWALNLGLVLLAVVVWRAALAVPDGRLHLTMLEVGGGEALLIQTPQGRSLLINGGASPNRLSDALGRRLPPGAGRLDYLIVAAASEEQLAGLPRLVERFPPGQALWSGPAAGEYSALQLRSALTNLRIPIVDAQTGQVLELGQGARLHVLSVEPRGAVLLLEWSNFRAMLPVGLDFDSMEALMKDHDLGPVTALLLADGGYAPLNPPEWIERWGPQLALLSVAAGNPDGLPHPETLQALGGIPLLRTDLNGWIELSTDGEQIWAEVERK